MVIGKGKGAVLLSQGDHISVCGVVNLIFNQNYEPAEEQPDEIQEAEKKVFIADTHVQPPGGISLSRPSYSQTVTSSPTANSAWVATDQCIWLSISGQSAS